jgi:hypothetical protein
MSGLTRATVVRLITVISLTAIACTNSATSGRNEPPEDNATAGASGNRAKWFEAACGLPLKYLKRIERGQFGRRSPDVQVVPKAPNFFGGFGPTSHSGPWPYLQQVPIVLYGPGFIAPVGDIAPNRVVTSADIAPTFADLVGMPWPEDRDGISLTEALDPERAAAPRLIVLIAWDGGGWNVLNKWPNAWPNLQRLIDEGASVTNAIVGSSPSVTPAVHATIGTGTWPSHHGIVDIPIRVHGRTVDAWQGRSPKFLRVPAFGDLWDEYVEGAAKMGVVAYKAWHIAMIGHGAYLEGADKDVAVIAQRKTGGTLGTHRRYYKLPNYLHDVGGLDLDIRQVDLADGELDDTWLGNAILDDPLEVMKTPAWVLYQTRLIKELLAGEEFGIDSTTDLFATNFKQLDEAGHTWNMVNPEVRSVLRYTDAALGDLIDWLDSEVGSGNYVVTLTADHGQTPHPDITGAWPINIERMRQATAEHFGIDADDLFLDERVTGFWLNPAALESNDVTAEEVSAFVLNHTVEANNTPGEALPDGYQERRNERVFKAVFPSDRLPEIMKCARAEA